MHYAMLEEGLERGSNGEAYEFEEEKTSEEEELSDLPRHTKVVVTINNRAKFVLSVFKVW
ncbi:hypothetical protein AMTR_s00098p00076700 [Amborella trichopoda]|uniref:Uncharacterized protein n=1 Tax=Amborella trichopoda TaxID=13333 RepID=W1NS40_AMBTC|nr:hypothetical protein AMTR_s00098p00076700 [Amborella trichopoda]